MLLWSTAVHVYSDSTEVESWSDQREERPREETLKEYWYLSEDGPLSTKQAARTVDSVLQFDAVQNLLCWLACFVHKGPPLPKFQIFPSQLRQTADRAASLSIKSLWDRQSSNSGPPPEVEFTFPFFTLDFYSKLWSFLNLRFFSGFMLDFFPSTPCYS
jgi:hypothetical protein